jgi:hypothetical protein
MKELQELIKLAVKQFPLKQGTYPNGKTFVPVRA